MNNPDRLANVYTTTFRAKGEISDRESAEEVILWCFGTSTRFKLPRHREIFEEVKRMLATAYGRGRDSMASDLRGLLSVKECTCADDR